MISSRFLASLLILCGLTLAGCQSRYTLGEITTSVEAIRTTSPAEGQALVTLRFINDNIVPVSFIKSSHKLYLNGTLVAEIENPTPVGLAPTTTATREFPVVFISPAHVQQLAGQVSYRLESKLEIQNGDNEYSLKGETKGSVTLGG